MLSLRERGSQPGSPQAGSELELIGWLPWGPRLRERGAKGAGDPQYGPVAASGPPRGELTLDLPRVGGRRRERPSLPSLLGGWVPLRGGRSPGITCPAALLPLLSLLLPALPVLRPRSGVYCRP